MRISIEHTEQDGARLGAAKEWNHDLVTFHELCEGFSEIAAKVGYDPETIMAHDVSLASLNERLDRQIAINKALLEDLNKSLPKLARLAALEQKGGRK